MLEPMQRKFSPEEHAQIAAMQAKQQGKALDAARLASEMALRQWCVMTAGGNVETAEYIYKFVTAPLNSKDET